MDDYFLDTQDCKIEPYSPVVGGDSGALYLASLKATPGVRYVVKSATPELACNEFMYQKVAAALGLHTQEVRLFRPSKRIRYAAGIRYSENARKCTVEDVAVGALHFADLIAFQTLYVILNEEDSQEHFIDEAGRLFKLDNAASFNLEEFNVSYACRATEDTAITLLQKSLNFTEYDKYGILLKLLEEQHGYPSRDACLSMFSRFSALDEALLKSALEALEEVYPVLISEYYRAFIESRKVLCTQFLSEIIEQG